MATSGTLSFANGVNLQTVSVTINGETSVEQNETFFVNLSAPTNGATIIDSQGVGTITDDDTPDAAGTISISDLTITEGNTGSQVATFNGDEDRRHGSVCCQLCHRERNSNCGK